MEFLAALASHRAASDRLLPSSLEVLQVLLDILKGVSTLRRHHSHKLHLLWLQWLCAEKGLQVKLSLRDIILVFFICLGSCCAALSLSVSLSVHLFLRLLDAPFNVSRLSAALLRGYADCALVLVLSHRHFVVFDALDVRQYVLKLLLFALKETCISLIFLRVLHGLVILNVLHAL